MVSNTDSKGEVLATIKAHSDAILKGDIEAALSFYAENWRDNHNRRKSVLKHRLEQAKEHYEESGLKIDFSAVTIKLDGASAIVSPVVHRTADGSLTYEHTLRKENDDQWLLYYSEVIDWEKAPLDPEIEKKKAEIEAAALANRAHRERLLGDPGRPGYHFVMPEGIAAPFDPNGAIFWKGRYHLFYIFQDKRLDKKSDHWGHVSSTDLFHWRHHRTFLLEGMYSGNCFLNKDGVPTICYHQVGQGNAMAIALDDDLDDWQKLGTITPNTKEGDAHHEKYRSWDPFAWVEGDTYYAIFGGEKPAIAKSSTLDGEWQYTRDLFAHGVDGVSLDEDVSCAELFKLNGKDVLLCISHRLGCRYYLGEWKNEQFYPETHAQMSWVDNEFFAPESLEDDRGRRIMWAWMMSHAEFSQRWNKGWAGIMSLPRVLSLGDDGQLLMDVPEEIEALRYRPCHLDPFDLPADSEQVADGVSGNSLELEIEMDSADASAYGVKVCVSPDGREETAIACDVAEGKLVIDTRKSGPAEPAGKVEAAPFELEHNERLKLRVFVDKSVIEVFANGRQAVARHIHPARQDSTGVTLFSTGGSARVHQLKSWHISPSNPY